MIPRPPVSTRTDTLLPYAMRIRARAADAAGRRAPVHLKADTGMHRIGVTPAEAVDVARAIVASDSLELEGVWTHCAVADDPEDPFTAEQLFRYDAVLGALADAGITVPLRHAANSAGAIAHPASRYDLVRCGIAVYGIAPSETGRAH